MRKLKTMILALLLILPLLTFGIGAMEVQAEQIDVAIDESNFPDEVFRSYVAENFDKDGDGCLSEAECLNVWHVSVNNMGITSVKGIEHFDNMYYLECQVNPLQSLDVSQNPGLESLWCADTGITELDLSNNPLLRQVVCGDNALAALDLSGLEQSPNYCVLSGQSICIDGALESFDLSNLPGFDASRAYNWRGAEYDAASNTISNFTSEVVTYEYDCGSGYSMNVALMRNESGVALNDVYFPDAAFRNHLSQNVDADGDGFLSMQELREPVVLRLSGGVESLQGLEFLLCLEQLYCRYQNISSLELDVASNVMVLNLEHNPIQVLDLSCFPNVNSLDCTDCTELYQINFYGDAPYFSEEAFLNVEAVAYYPESNETWTEEVLLDYGGSITWRAYDPDDHVHVLEENVTAPICEEQGYTTYTCRCGETYHCRYTDGYGHCWDAGAVIAEPTELAQGVKRYTCQICGETKDEGFDRTIAQGEAVSLPDEIIAHTNQQAATRQYACEAVGGIYFLVDEKLNLLDLDTGSIRLVYEFPEKSPYVYACGDMLYWSNDGYIIAVDLAKGALDHTLMLDNVTFTHGIGVDEQGRILLSVLHEDKHLLNLYSPEGDLLDSKEIGTTVYEFSGFAETGEVYFVAYYNWYYWGYEHDMYAMHAAKLSGDSFVPIVEDFYFLNLYNICQMYYQQTQFNGLVLNGELLGDVNGNIIQATGLTDELTVLMNIPREMDEEPGYTYNTNYIGPRVVYDEDTGHIIAYTSDCRVIEYDPATGESLSLYETDHYVFNLLRYGDWIVAIEKEAGVYYLEWFELEDMEELTLQTIDLNQTKTYMDHTADSVKERWEQAYIGPDIPVYASGYSLSPYSGAVYTSEMKEAMVEYSNYLRWLGGLTPFTASEDAVWEREAKGAVVLTANNEMSHEPSQPADMDDAFYADAYEACSNSNLYSHGVSNASQAMSYINGWLDDTANASSLELGHRFHFLQREGISISYGSTPSKMLQRVENYGTQINTNGTVEGVDNNDFCYTWPGAGAFPANAISTRALWSINLNEDMVDLSNVPMTVTIKDLDSGEVFDRTDSLGSSAYYGISSYFGYFYGKCFYFDPPEADSYDGKRYQVTVGNLQLPNGQPAEIIYTVEFCTLEHSWDEGVVIKEPTALENGEKRYTCTYGCGATRTEILEHEHSFDPAKDTVVPPTCAEQGYTIHFCVCGRSIYDTYTPAVGHNWSAWAVTTEPTQTQPGVKTSRCVNCGSIQTESIPAQGSSDPDAGDSVAPPSDEKPENPQIPPVVDKPIHNPFVDVTEDQYYYTPVLWAVEKNITTGTSATTFSPNSPCTRAQVVTFLWRASGSLQPNVQRNPFKDVQPGAYYYNAVLWAVENGITTGTDASHFSPDAPCTRAQVVTFLWRYYDMPESEVKFNPFLDVSAKEYYYGSVLWAVENGITTGITFWEFGPDATCTRGQIVTFLHRAMSGMQTISNE